MSNTRPAVPAALDRAVKEEAGYRCAIPTCRQTAALENAHIIPWAKVKEHKFANLICLCAICHTRFDRGEIPVKSMLQFKANLSLLSHRYTQVENQALQFFASLDYVEGAIRPPSRPIHPGMTMLFSNLVKDGLFQWLAFDWNSSFRAPDVEYMYLAPTPAGIDFMRRMLEAGEL